MMLIIIISDDYSSHGIHNLILIYFSTVMKMSNVTFGIVLLLESYHQSYMQVHIKLLKAYKKIKKLNVNSIM